jgi:hypothetical protein
MLREIGRAAGFQAAFAVLSGWFETGRPVGLAEIVAKGHVSLRQAKREVKELAAKGLIVAEGDGYRPPLYVEREAE